MAQGPREQSVSFKAQGLIDSAVFARILAGARLFERLSERDALLPARDLATVTIDLRGAGLFHLVDVATLALVIRRLAESKVEVSVLWPRVQDERASRFLDRVGFGRLLLRPTGSTSDWRDNVHIRRKETVDRGSSLFSQDEGTSRYVPLTWIQRADFVEDSDSIWDVRPEINPARIVTFRQVLERYGYLDERTTTLLLDVMLLELGWNVVLHSNANPDLAYGLFAAHANPQSQQKQAIESGIHFCVADLGRGIPQTLGAVYKRQREHDHSLSSQSSAVLRFALEPDSTSRPLGSRIVQADGYRGLALVADSLGDSGLLSMRSDGGGVRAIGTETAPTLTVDESFVRTPLPGTQVLGFLSAQQQRRTSTSSAAAQPFQANLNPSIVRLPARDTRSTPAEIEHDLERRLRRIPNGDTIVIDFGYGDKHIHAVEQVVKTAARVFRSREVLLFNVSSAPELFSHLREWTQEGLVESNVGVAVVHGHDSAWQLFESKRGLFSPVHRTLERVIGSWDAQRYLDLAHHANTALLAAGFDAGGPDSGFYTGRIHLSSGEVVGRFFSLLTHLDADPAHLRLWSETCVAAIKKLLGTEPIDPDLTFVGFASGMREVLANVVRAFQSRHKAILLLTYDVPSREELRAALPGVSRVVLLTDVLSTASLAQAVTDLLDEAGITVTGLVALVDARKDGVRLRAGSSELPVISGASLDPLAPLSGPPSGEYWLDPVSLIPTAESPERQYAEVESRIKLTIQLLADAEAVRCGHVVDGTRHSSTYIDLRAVLSVGREIVAKYVNAELGRRLSAPGWSGFAPTEILVPRGVARIEHVEVESPDGPRTLTAYQTAVRDYASLLNGLWSSASPKDVLRSFEPSGRSRVARTVVADATPAVHPDVVIADDGMSSGRTVQALIQVALDRGARRILIVPLLARMSPQDVQYWESVTHLRTSTEADVLVSYCFPLVLPIAYSTASECPYEATIARWRLLERTWIGASGVLSRVANGLIERLEGRRPDDLTRRDPVFERTWMELRSLVTLAASSEQALERLKDAAAQTQSREAQLATLSLFLEEWRLLGQSRLRQVLLSKLEHAALDAARTPTTSAEMRATALSLLRTVRRSDYLSYVAMVPEEALGEPEVAERVLFNLASLPPTSLSDSRMPVCLDRLVAALSKSASANPRHDATERVAELLSTVRSIRLRSGVRASDDSRQAAARTLWTALETDSFLKHSTVLFLDNLRSRSPTYAEASAKTFQHLAEDWRELHQPKLKNLVLGPMRTLSPLFKVVASSVGSQFLPTEVDYLVAQEPHSPVEADIGSIETYLEILGSGAAGQRFSNLLAGAAGRLRNHVVGPDATIHQLLEKVQRVKVGEMIAILKSGLSTLSAERNVDVSVDERLTGLQGEVLFAPQDLIQACLASIMINLQRHAFPPRHDPGSGRIEVHADIIREKDAKWLELIVWNDGAPLNGAMPSSRANARLNELMAELGGEFGKPQISTRVGWTVFQSMRSLLW